jgi:hypothetical protein
MSTHSTESGFFTPFCTGEINMAKVKSKQKCYSKYLFFSSFYSVFLNVQIYISNSSSPPGGDGDHDADS